jgi:transposase
MKQKSGCGKALAEQVLKDIRQQTRRQYSAEERIRIVLEGLRGEENISELWRRRHRRLDVLRYYGWSKEFLEAGKRRLPGDTARAASSGEVKDVRRGTSALKEVVASPSKAACLKKHERGWGGRHEVSYVPESRDHRIGRAVTPAGQAHAGQAWCPPGHVLQIRRFEKRTQRACMESKSAGALEALRNRLVLRATLPPARCRLSVVRQFETDQAFRDECSGSSGG